MHSTTILTDVVVLFGCALVVLLLSRRLKVPTVVGFLVTGAIAGPTGLGLIGSTEAVETVSELGVIFLLFIVALELSLPRLRGVARYILVGGSLQFGLTAGAGWVVAHLIGFEPGPAAVAAMALAMSSTAIVLKVLSDRNELSASHGRAALGILIFQDLVFIPLLLVVPLLVGVPDTAELGAAWLRIGAGLAGVALAFVIGRTLMPVLLRQIVESGIRELFIVTALFVCLGGSLLSGSLGLSPALGAFLAGLLIADSEYHYHVMTETGPFRDVFTSLFFISVGMLLDVRFALMNWAAVLALAALAMVGKALVVALSVAMLGLHGRARVLTAVALAQVGEFAFVLLGAGMVTGLRDGPFVILVPAAILTMLVSPFAIHAATERWDRLTSSRADALLATSAEEAKERVLVSGFGLNGQTLVRVLRSAGVPTVVVDLDGRRSAQAAGPNTRVVHGDVTRPDVLRRAGVHTVDVAAFALSDPAATVTAVRAARFLNPKLLIIARADRVAEIDALKSAGANEVVAEEFETSIEIVTRLLRRLHVSGNVIRAEARLLRAHAYEMLRRVEGEVGLTDRLAQALAAGATDTVSLSNDSPAVGATLSRLHLRNRTGATVVSVVRDGRAQANPSSEWVFQPNDILFLLGSHEEIQSAMELLDPTAADT